MDFLRASCHGLFLRIVKLDLFLRHRVGSMHQEPLVRVVVVHEELLHNLDLDVSRHPLSEDPKEGTEREDVEPPDQAFSHPAGNIGRIMGYCQSLDGGGGKC